MVFICELIFFCFWRRSFLRPYPPPLVQAEADGKSGHVSCIFPQCPRENGRSIEKPLEKSRIYGEPGIQYGNLGTVAMTPERYRQIEELYNAARDGTAEQRAVLLAEADPELRSELESLLAQPSSGEFIDRPAIQNTPQLSDDSAITRLAAGSFLGPYRIEYKLGAGGMGEVFGAID